MSLPESMSCHCPHSILWASRGQLSSPGQMPSGHQVPRKCWASRENIGGVAHSPHLPGSEQKAGGGAGPSLPATRSSGQTALTEQAPRVTGLPGTAVYQRACPDDGDFFLAPVPESRRLVTLVLQLLMYLRQGIPLPDFKFPHL